jgi:catalase
MMSTCRDGIKFPDMVHALKPNPKNHIQEGWRIMDFFSHVPESMNMVRFPVQQLGAFLVLHGCHTAHWSQHDACRHSCQASNENSNKNVCVLQFTFLLDDVGIPKNYRTMDGFGVHTYKLINRAGKETYVKFHWKTKQGVCFSALNAMSCCAVLYAPIKHDFILPDFAAA